MASRLTIRGPDLNQRWEFSAYVTFRMEFTGYGLTSDDVIRIIPGNGNCDDNNQEPDAKLHRPMGNRCFLLGNGEAVFAHYVIHEGVHGANMTFERLCIQGHQP